MLKQNVPLQVPSCFYVYIIYLSFFFQFPGTAFLKLSVITKVDIILILIPQFCLSMCSLKRRRYIASDVKDLSTL